MRVLRVAVLWFFSVIFVVNASSQEVSLAEVWSAIQKVSPSQEAARLEEQYINEVQQRASRHWWPRLYVDARSYKTNDPGASFFGLLAQREVRQSDFDPNSLNHPDSSTLTRGALGIDLALYEGHFKINQLSLLDHSLKAQQWTRLQVELEQYTQVSLAYGSLIVLQSQSEKLSRIENELAQLIKKYQIGQKSNPIGYSGLLGMKSLANRIAGLLAQYKAQEASYYQMLLNMGLKKEVWKPVPTKSQVFIDQYLKISPGDTTSKKIKAAQEGVQSAYEQAQMERSRYLPRVGAFAESYLFNGRRETANGYTAGVYLQWNLFDPSDFGRYQEAKTKALTAEKQIQALQEQESSDFFSAQETNRALRTNLKLLEESDQLLKEQMQVATSLFKNGSITALQLVEIMNRRTDLIAQQNELEMGLIKSASQAITKTGFQIPFAADKGERQ